MSAVITDIEQLDPINGVYTYAASWCSTTSREM